MNGLPFLASSALVTASPSGPLGKSGSEQATPNEALAGDFVRGPTLRALGKGAGGAPAKVMPHRGPGNYEKL